MFIGTFPTTHSCSQMVSLQEQRAILLAGEKQCPNVEKAFPGLPLAPKDKIDKIVCRHREIVERATHNQLDRTSEKDVAELFRWARETLDFVETAGTWDVGEHTVQAAVDIIVVISQWGSGVNGILTKFTGAANYSMGVWYQFGLFGYKKDAAMAVSYFRLSAQQGYDRALYRIGNVYERLGVAKPTSFDDKQGSSSANIAAAVSCYESGAQNGDAACLYRLGMAYLRGQLGFDINIPHAMKLLEHANKVSDPDCPQASYIYGLILSGNLRIDGAGATYDGSAGASLSSASEEQLNLSVEFSVQLQQFQNSRAGVSAIERAAWMSYGPALVWMARAYAGHERGSNCAISLRYLQIASRQAFHRRWLKANGHKPRGVLLAGNIRGVPEAELAKWFLCGQPGVLEPQYSTAYSYALLSGECEGNSIGQFALGFFAESGLAGTCNSDPDFELAKKWYRMSARNGNQDARMRLASLGLSALRGTSESPPVSRSLPVRTDELAQPESMPEQNNQPELPQTNDSSLQQSDQPMSPKKAVCFVNTPDARFLTPEQEYASEESLSAQNNESVTNDRDPPAQKYANTNGEGVPAQKYEFTKSATEPSTQKHELANSHCFAHPVRRPVGWLEQRRKIKSAIFDPPSPRTIANTRDFTIDPEAPSQSNTHVPLQATSHAPAPPSQVPCNNAQISTVQTKPEPMSTYEAVAPLHFASTPLQTPSSPCPVIPPLRITKFSMEDTLKSESGAETTVEEDSSQEGSYESESNRSDKEPTTAPELTPTTSSELAFGDFDSTSPALSKWPSNMSLNRRRRMNRLSNESVRSNRSQSSYKSALSRTSSWQSLQSARSSWSVQTQSMELKTDSDARVALSFDEMDVSFKEEQRNECKVM